MWTNVPIIIVHRSVRVRRRMIRFDSIRCMLVCNTRDSSNSRYNQYNVYARKHTPRNVPARLLRSPRCSSLHQSQYLMSPSQLHVATLLVSNGCHSHPITTCSCAFNVLKHFCVFQSQNQTLPSPSPEKMNRLSGEKPIWHAYPAL